MAAAVPLRSDFDAAQLRALAKRAQDPDQTRRLLALAAIYDGASRTEAAQIGCVTLQIVRDWVLRFNAHGPEGLLTGRAPGAPPRASDRNLTLEGEPCLNHVAVLRRPVAGTTEAGAGACNRHITLGDVKEPYVRILTAQKVTINRESGRNRE